MGGMRVVLGVIVLVVASRAVAQGATAEADVGPSVRVTWEAGRFSPQSTEGYLVYRSDVNDADSYGHRKPVGVVGFGVNKFVDSTSSRVFDYPSLPLSGSPSLRMASSGSVSGVTVGAPVTYQVTAIYKAGDRYFEGAPQVTGQATALLPPTLLLPTNGYDSVNFRTMQFTFTGHTVQLDYALQYSSDATMNSCPDTWLVGPIPLNQTQITLTAGDIRAQYPDPNVWLYWQVGVRNPSDVPGPAPDGHGHRYVWSAMFSCRQPDFPPPPGPYDKLARGTIFLDDYVGNPSEEPFTLDIYNGAEIVSHLQVWGNDWLVAVQPGIYKFVLRGKHWLAQSQMVDLHLQNQCISFHPINGDCTGDNAVDDFDMIAVALDFGGVPSGNYGFTDLSGDGNVDDYELLIVLINFGLSGD